MTSRSRASAKAAGTRFEREQADCLAEQLGDDRIDRAPLRGAKDRGDLMNVRLPGNQRLTIECKNERPVRLGVGMTEAEAERVNDGGLAAALFHKRHGRGDPLDQYVTMTVRDLLAIITGTRP
jgi:hypothetical protein